MDIKNFYNQSPKLWKTILGNDLHYHVGWGDGDIFLIQSNIFISF